MDVISPKNAAAMSSQNPEEKETFVESPKQAESQKNEGTGEHHVVVSVPTADDGKVAGTTSMAKTLSHVSQVEGAEPDNVMKFLLCAVAMLEGADVAVLGPCLQALQTDVGLKLTDLAYLGVAQAVCTNLAAPLWGILADRGTLSRKTILIVGSLGQGLVTVCLAFVTVMTPMIFLRALNGIMLASLRPISNGIVADSTCDAKRGAMFGKVQAALVVGMLFSTLLAGPIANKDIVGIQGWRVAFVLVGSISLIVGVLLKLLMVEPPKEDLGEEDKSGGSAVLEEIGSLLSFFRIKTFCIMIMQGIFGTIPWTVMGNQFLFFQLSGISDENATALATEQLVIGIFGNLLGGYIGDFLAGKFGLNGRPLNAQITVAAGIPLIYMMYAGIRPGDGDVLTYGILIAIWGLVGCWAQSGTNFPILSEIVPPNARSRVMAWECALENSIASAIGPPVVAFLATYCFGYTFGQDSADNGADLNSARALGKAMTIVIIAPSTICLIAYSVLHITYPRDVKNMHEDLMGKRMSREVSKQASQKGQADAKAGSE
eukprot:TRINITY_DN287_c0_g1_i2.p1 TRINITY_DN287_c0_g1~~TRINITY_DN287_c0_g1_i2.p1  ORF type:complete len:544 (+),score=135.45 TRINITY_DN287_c0_g1_i2:123-1754(+)